MTGNMEQIYNLLSFIFERISISTFILFLVMILLFYIAWNTQSRKDFDFADMLRNGGSRKPSATRLASLICLIITSWGIVYAFLAVLGRPALVDKEYLTMLTTLFGIYMGIWSGSKVVEKAIDAWTLWKTGAQPASVVSTSTSTTSTTVSAVVEPPESPEPPNPEVEEGVMSEPPETRKSKPKVK